MAGPAVLAASAGRSSPLQDLCVRGTAMSNTQHQSACPKCGYDQAGEIATWQTSCPVRGMCTECAYEFEWANVLDPARINLLWYVEHATRKRDQLRRSVSTLLMLAIPNRYWRRVRVLARIRIPMLLLWLLMILMVLHTFALIPVGLGNWQETWGMMRGGGYSDFAQHGMLGYAYELHNALFAPFLRIQYGSYGTSFHLGGYFHQDVLAALALPGFVALPTTMWLLLIWLLPVTRRQVSIRTIHLVRAWLLTLLPVLVLFESTRVVSGIYSWYNGTGTILTIIPILFLIILVLSLVWVQWFWIAALRVGWGVRPVLPIAVLGTVASLLTTSILFVTLFW